jgi:hypothetical protein
VSNEGTVLHVYGVVPAASQLELPDSGIDGASVDVAEASGLVALVSRLDAARYGEEVWREHAEDPEWLAGFATQHQDVLGSVATTCDVLPFRIPGMYDDEARLLGVLEAEQDLLRRGLEAVGGHVEWGVQVFLTDQAEEEPTPQPQSGRDYLRRRSEQAGARERATEERRTRVLDAYGMIADASTHSVANPPQDPALSKRSEPMLLNSAHLVPRDRKESFFAVLVDVQGLLRERGMVVEVSGPWPAYNFVHLATEELQA